jgi:hypothetical protein
LTVENIGHQWVSDRNDNNSNVNNNGITALTLFAGRSVKSCGRLFTGVDRPSLTPCDILK